MAERRQRAIGVLAREEKGNLRKLCMRRGKKTGKGGELGKKTAGIAIESELHKKWTKRG